MKLARSYEVASENENRPGRKLCLPEESALKKQYIDSKHLFLLIYIWIFFE